MNDPTLCMDDKSIVLTTPEKFFIKERMDESRCLNIFSIQTIQSMSTKTNNLHKSKELSVAVDVLTNSNISEQQTPTQGPEEKLDKVRISNPVNKRNLFSQSFRGAQKEISEGFHKFKANKTLYINRSFDSSDTNKLLSLQDSPWNNRRNDRNRYRSISSFVYNGVNLQGRDISVSDCEVFLMCLLPFYLLFKHFSRKTIYHWVLQFLTFIPPIGQIYLFHLLGLNCLRNILCAFLPPISLLDRQFKMNKCKFCKCLFLTFQFWYPGMIYAYTNAKTNIIYFQEM